MPESSCLYPPPRCQRTLLAFKQAGVLAEPHRALIGLSAPPTQDFILRRCPPFPCMPSSRKLEFLSMPHPSPLPLPTLHQPSCLPDRHLLVSFRTLSAPLALIYLPANPEIPLTRCSALLTRRLRNPFPFSFPKGRFIHPLFFLLCCFFDVPCFLPYLQAALHDIGAFLILSNAPARH